MQVQMKIEDSKKDWADLKMAVGLLESPTLTAKISNMLGGALEKGMNLLPDGVIKEIPGVVEEALNQAANAALLTLENKPNTEASTILSKIFTGVSGAVGGAGGFATLLAEIPVSTVLMMRSIADIARSEGFDLDDIKTKYACIEVFGLGGNTSDDDSTDTGYYVVRGFATEAMAGLGKGLSEVAVKNAARITPSQTGAFLAKLIESIAARFGVVITEKIALMAVPLIGAITGAALNLLFTDFYQDMARGHFVVKRLENKYGEEYIKAKYLEIKG